MVAGVVRGGLRATIAGNVIPHKTGLDAGQRRRAQTGISQQCIYFKLLCPRSGIKRWSIAVSVYRLCGARCIRFKKTKNTWLAICWLGVFACKYKPDWKVR